jgi:hypothetical protein
LSEVRAAAAPPRCAPSRPPSPDPWPSAAGSRHCATCPRNGLRKYATAWTPVPALTEAGEGTLVRRTAPGLGAADRDIVRRVGGTPLALRTLASGGEKGSGDLSLDHAVAPALAALPWPARTAIAALGLLDRPAPAALLGPDLTDTGALETVETHVRAGMRTLGARTRTEAAALVLA